MKFHECECLSQLSPCHQQRLHDLTEARHIVDKLVDAIVEPCRSNDAYLEPEVAQRSANVILDGDGLLLQQLAGPSAAPAAFGSSASSHARA